MISIFKKGIATLISINLIFTQSLIAGIIGTPDVTDGTTTCRDISETDYFPIGDNRGFSILTKKEKVRECIITKTVQGDCIKWETTKEDFTMTPGKYNAYETKNFDDAIGSLLAQLGTYDQLGHMWSGWKGFCETGWKSDYSWAEDPMFWASMAMSMVMSGSSEGGFLSDTAVGSGVNSAADTIGQAASDSLASAGADLTEDIATDIVSDTLSTEGANLVEAKVVDSAEEITKDIVEEAIDSAVNEFYNNLGRCFMSAGFNLVKTFYEFSQDDDEATSCDPVDEICDSGAEATGESEIMTMDQVEFDDLISEALEEDPPQDLYEFIYELPTSPQDGIVSFRMKKQNEMEGADSLDQAAADEMKEKAKEIKAYISLGISGLAMASCLGGLGDGVQEGSSTDSDRADLRQGLGMAMGFASKFMGPYGALIGAVLKIAMYAATSYEDIDACGNEDDAKNQGKRQEQTQKSIEFGLCHFIGTTCSEYSIFVGDGGFLDNSCSVYGFSYCCYDQILTKVLVVQLKSQLGRDFSHCGGITIRDLNYVSFKQCSDSQMSDSSYVDGATYILKTGVNSESQLPNYLGFKMETTNRVSNIGGTPLWSGIAGGGSPEAFQHRFKCVDMTEFMEYLQGLIGEDMDMEDFEDYWNDLTEQNVYAG